MILTYQYLTNFIGKSFFKNILRIHEAILEGEDFDELFEQLAHRRFLMHLIGHHMYALHYSVPGVLIGENDGTTIYPIVGGLFRHSCNPNAVLVTSGRSTIAVTIQPIKMGDEITISYMPEELEYSKKNRQKSLLKQYKFQCKCKRCTSPATMTQSREVSLDAKFKNDIRKPRNFELMNISKRNSLMNKCVKYLDKCDPETWNDKKCLVLLAYTRFLRTKYYLNWEF